MKHFNLYFFFVLFFSFGAFAKQDQDIEAIRPAAADEQAITALVDSWNNLLNKHQDVPPQSLYAPEVKWYGQTIPARQVIENEHAFLVKNKDYRQMIMSTLNIQFDYEKKGVVTVSFVKRAGVAWAQEQNYPQELQVVKDAQGWRIISETDGITRANQSKEKSTEVVRGKFNGEKVSYAWMSDADPRTGAACTPESNCRCFLWSSDPGINPVSMPQCQVGMVEVISGLDDSGRDRVVVSPEWLTSSSHLVYVYDIQQGQWTRVLPVIPKDFNIQETARATDLLQRDRQHAGWVKVTRAVWNEEKEGMVTEVVPQKLWVLK